MYKSANSSVKGTFHVELIDDVGRKTELSLFSPKLKTLNKFSKIDENDSLDEVIEVLTEILSRNKENIEISIETVENIFDFEDIDRFFDKYFSWVEETKKK